MCACVCIQQQARAWRKRKTPSGKVVWFHAETEAQTEEAPMIVKKHQKFKKSHVRVYDMLTPMDRRTARLVKSI